MITCKDCIHYDVCNFHIDEETELTVLECSHFKNKTDYAEVRHGKWVRQEGKPNEPEARCSECGRVVVYQIVNGKWEFEIFCPHCGTRMDR